MEIEGNELKMVISALSYVFFDQYPGGQEYRELHDRLKVATGGEPIDGWGKPSEYDDEEEED